MGHLTGNKKGNMIMIEIQEYENGSRLMAVAIVDRLERETARKTIEESRESFGLNYGDIASALDVTRRMLLRYRKEKNTPSPKVRDRLEALRQISHLLDEVFTDREDALQWLYTPVPLLQGRRPIDLMRKGKLDEVLSVLAGHHSGAFM
jgi:putative toxin-antitoxin system antitoxin component (TIGR02293 family)